MVVNVGDRARDAAAAIAADWNQLPGSS